MKRLNKKEGIVIVIFIVAMVLVYIYAPKPEAFKLAEFDPYTPKSIVNNNEAIRGAAIRRIQDDPKNMDHSFVV